MSWQLIFKAPDDVPEHEEPTPMVRKPVSVTLQLEQPGTLASVAAGDDDDDDD